MRLRNRVLDPLLILAAIGLTLAGNGALGRGASINIEAGMIALFALIVTTLSCSHSTRSPTYFLPVMCVSLLLMTTSSILQEDESSAFVQYRAIPLSTLFMVLAGVVSREFYLFKCRLVVKGILTQKNLQPGTFVPISAQLDKTRRSACTSDGQLMDPPR